MGAYKNKTMNNAFGNVNREWKYMVRLAIRIREGQYTERKIQEYKKLFIGIYKRLLDDPIDQLYQERDGYKRVS